MKHSKRLNSELIQGRLAEEFRLQKWLENILGISQSTLSRMLIQKKIPNGETLLKIAKALEINMSDLIIDMEEK